MIYLLIIALLLGTLIGWLISILTYRPYLLLEERIARIENTTPNVKTYAEQHQKLENVIEYLDIKLETPKPYYKKNPKEKHA